MNRLLLIISILGVSGCSTTDLESNPPIYAGHSSKSPDEMNKCLSLKWIALKASSASVPTDKGFQISSSDEWMGAVSLVKIDKSPDGGSDIKVYALSKGLNDPWGNAARSCL